MGLDVSLILEVRQSASDQWQGFYPKLLGINESLTRDYDFLKALGVYPDQIESHPLKIQRGLPPDASDLTLQASCHLVFRSGGISADVNADDGIEADGPTRIVTKRGVRFTYCTKGFCRNHTWMSYGEVVESLEHHGLDPDSIAAGYKKLLQRADWFEKKGFETRLICWVCN